VFYFKKTILEFYTKFTHMHAGLRYKLVNRYITMLVHLIRHANAIHIYCYHRTALIFPHLCVVLKTKKNQIYITQYIII